MSFLWQQTLNKSWHVTPFLRADRESSLNLSSSLSKSALMCNVHVPLHLYMAAFSLSLCIDSIVLTECPLPHDHVHLLAMTSVGPYIIIILYTDTGSVFRLGGCAGAKRGAGRWPGIGEKRKHATASSHIFLILTSHQLIKTTHEVAPLTQLRRLWGTWN